MILSQSQYVNIPLFCPLGGITLESALNQLPEFLQGVYPSGAHTVFSGLPAPVSLRIYFPTENKPPALQSLPLVLHLE